jgi:hypothetical protein
MLCSLGRGSRHLRVEVSVAPNPEDLASPYRALGYEAQREEMEANNIIHSAEVRVQCLLFHITRTAVSEYALGPD